MKISEAVESLQKKLVKYGDVEFNSDDEGYWTIGTLCFDDLSAEEPVFDCRARIEAENERQRKFSERHPEYVQNRMKYDDSLDKARA